ncbi:membrane protein [Arthrobacter phage DanielleIgnace]|nr:membrane protein [Arthrobacter phage DanielleIgnace]
MMAVLLTLMAPAAETGGDTFLGIPMPVLLALIGIIGGVVGAASTQWAKKIRTPQDDREDKVVVLEASNNLIERFQTLLKESDEKHAKEINELSTKVNALQGDVDSLRKEKFTLATALIAASNIAKKYGGQAAEDELRRIRVPDGMELVSETVP